MPLRRLLPVVALVACGEPPVCDDATCVAVCEDHRVAMQAHVPEGGTLLSPYESQILGDALRQVRQGVDRDGPDGFGVCVGRDACDRFLGASPPDVLGPGDYLVRARLVVPPVGVWRARYEGTCRDGDQVVDRVERDLVLRPDEAGIAGFHALQRLHVRPGADPSRTLSCTFVLVPEDPMGRVHFAGAQIPAG